MTVTSYIVLGVVVIIIAVAVIKVVTDKKKGVKCTGCPGCIPDGDGCPYDDTPGDV